LKNPNIKTSFVMSGIESKINTEPIEKDIYVTKEILNVLDVIDDEDLDEIDMEDVVIDNSQIPEIDHVIPLPVEFYKPPYNRIRRAKIMLFGSSLLSYIAYKELSDIKKFIILQKIERACYNYTIDRAYEENIITCWDIDLFCDVYHSTCYKISVNLEPKGLVCNPTLAKNLLSGKISINNLPKLTSPEMFPQKYVKIMKRIEASKNASQTIKTSTMYQCGRCKENRCSIENVYNRSLDEGVNLRIKCMNCDYEFGA
jgi:DNA-directed RNA polymerase subunit M/transcription elongation factor TFIIS